MTRAAVKGEHGDRRDSITPSPSDCVQPCNSRHAVRQAWRIKGLVKSIAPLSRCDINPPYPIYPGESDRDGCVGDATPDRRFAQLNFIAVIPEFFGLKSPLLAAVGSRLLSIGCPPGWSSARPRTGIGSGHRAIENEGFQPT